MIRLSVLVLSVFLLTGCGNDTPNQEVVKHIKETCKSARGQYFTGYSESPLGMWSIEVGYGGDDHYYNTHNPKLDEDYRQIEEGLLDEQ